MKSKRKRVFPQAKPEPNNGKKITQLVQTRSPIEALKMLRAGQPIDIMLGWYVDRGEADADVFKMDRLEKLHKLEELKSRRIQLEKEITEQINIQSQFKQQQQNEQKNAGQDKTSSPSAAGTSSSNEEAK